MPDIIAEKLTMIAGDRLRLPQATLTTDEGDALNLAGCEVAFRMVDYHTGDVAVNNQPAMKLQIDADQSTWGQVTYLWQGGDTETAGLYQAWFIISTSDGLTTRCPVDNSYFILINPAL